MREDWDILLGFYGDEEWDDLQPQPCRSSHHRGDINHYFMEIKPV
jgi:hypothetical protein